MKYFILVLLAGASIPIIFYYTFMFIDYLIDKWW